MSRHFLMIGFGTKYTYIKSAITAGDRVSLLITESKLKPNQEQFFNTVVKVKNMYDWAEVLPAVEQLNQQFPIDAVVTRYEPYLSVMGALNQRFGLSGIDYPTSRNFSNKYLMKHCFVSKQVACAAGITVDTLDQLDDFLATHSFPMILKKTTGTHSSYVLKVFSKQDLLEKRELLKKKAKHYGIARQMSNYTVVGNEPGLILEELLVGRELTVDTFVSNDSFTHVGLCEYVLAKDVQVDDSYLPIRTMPASVTPVARDLILQTVEQGLRALGAKNCVCHTEVFYDETNHTCSIVESTARGGGNRSEMARLSSGYDYDGAVFKVCIGEYRWNVEAHGAHQHARYDFIAVRYAYHGVKRMGP